MTHWTTGFITQQVVMFGLWAWVLIYLAWPTILDMVEVYKQ